MAPVSVPLPLDFLSFCNLHIEAQIYSKMLSLTRIVVRVLTAVNLNCKADGSYEKEMGAYRSLDGNQLKKDLDSSSVLLLSTISQTGKDVSKSKEPDHYSGLKTLDFRRFIKLGCSKKILLVKEKKF